MKSNRTKSGILVTILSLMIITLIAGCTSTVKTGEVYDPKIKPSDFVSRIDNKYFTLTPGMTLVYEGETEEGTEHVEVAILNETKVVMGIECMVIHDQVFLDGDLIEETLDWYAQDKDGNVWYMGEDSKEIENGEVISTEGSWEAGVDGAKTGIIMLADPKAGDEYRQEYYEGEAEDFGKIVALVEKAEVPYGLYEDCLMTRDWTPLEENIDEYKYYSLEIGAVVLEISIYSGERIELVDIITE